MGYLTRNPKNRKSPLVDLRREETINGPGKPVRSGLHIMTGHRNKNFNPNDFEMAGGGGAQPAPAAPEGQEPVYRKGGRLVKWVRK